MERGDSLSRPTQRTNMKTDVHTETTVTIRLEEPNTTVSLFANLNCASLLVFYDKSGDSLKLWLAPEGIAALRKALPEPALAVVDS